MFLKYDDRIINIDKIDIIEKGSDKYTSVRYIYLQQDDITHTITFEGEYERDKAFDGITNALFAGNPIYVVVKGE